MELGANLYFKTPLAFGIFRFEARAPARANIPKG
jgi:hypothetical protein